MVQACQQLMSLSGSICSLIGVFEQFIIAKLDCCLFLKLSKFTWSLLKIWPRITNVSYNVSNYFSNVLNDSCLHDSYLRSLRI